MEQQERQRDTNTGPGQGGSSPTGDANRTRRRALEFSNAADEAITRGLATDSVAFLESTLQEGGE